LQPKPIVSVIGEFWAMTTEGDGNYQLQRFLESEGAEVAIQPLTNWVLYIFWEQISDTKTRMELRGADGAHKGLEGKDPWKKLLILQAARKAFLATFRTFAAAVGLTDYHLPDMDRIAELAHQHYDNDIRGGEGHMEVGKVLDCVEEQHAHMILSVKPFGCMPSSGVSDGVQSLIQTKQPDAIFLPIETTGDGKVNVESRVQMMLFKAHERARTEFEKAVQESGMSLDDLQTKLAKKRKLSGAMYHPRHNKAGTGANMVYALA